MTDNEFYESIKNESEKNQDWGESAQAFVRLKNVEDPYITATVDKGFGAHKTMRMDPETGVIMGPTAKSLEKSAGAESLLRNPSVLGALIGGTAGGTLGAALSEKGKRLKGALKGGAAGAAAGGLLGMAIPAKTVGESAGNLAVLKDVKKTLPLMGLGAAAIGAPAFYGTTASDTPGLSKDEAEYEGNIKTLEGTSGKGFVGKMRVGHNKFLKDVATAYKENPVKGTLLSASLGATLGFQAAKILGAGK